MKCIKEKAMFEDCDKVAEYLYKGNSYCDEHYEMEKKAEMEAY